MTNNSKFKQKALRTVCITTIKVLDLNSFMHGTSSRWTWRRRCLPAHTCMFWGTVGGNTEDWKRITSTNRFRRKEFQASNASQFLLLRNTYDRHRTTTPFPALAVTKMKIVASMVCAVVLCNCGCQKEHAILGMSFFGVTGVRGGSVPSVKNLNWHVATPCKTSLWICVRGCIQRYRNTSNKML